MNAFQIKHGLLALCGCLCATASAQTSFYNIGNSFSDHIAGTPNIGLSLGHSFDWGRHMIPGASLNFIQKNPTGGFQDQGYYPQALPNKAWDVVSLQPWNESLATYTNAAIDLSTLAYQGNPDVKIVVLATSSFTLINTATPGDFYNDFNSLSAASSASRAYFEGAVDNLRAQFPGKTIALIPVQHVLAELDRRLAAGDTIPEITTILDVLDEKQGHFGDKGRYLACLTAYATVVRQSPVGALSGNYFSDYTVSPEFAAYAQQLIWDVVQAEPYAALVEAGGLPKAILEADVLRGTAPLTVQFDGSNSTDSDGSITSYAWEIDGQVFNGATPPAQNFTAGVYPATLTVTDNEGKTNSQTVYIQAASGNTDPVALEAECATVGANWTTAETAFASLAAGLTPAPGYNNTSNSTPPSGLEDRVTFNFEIPANGSYTIYARVSAPTTSDDSFWVRVNGGSWFVWNNIGNGTAAFIWSALPGTYTLPTGPVTIDFAYREDGTILDKIQLSTSATAPTGMGLPGINCFYDEENPSTPSGLNASNLLVNGVTLNWSPSTDNVAVTGYRIFRDSTLIGTTTGTSFPVNGLAPDTAYDFTVVAFDEAKNSSLPSTGLNVVTPVNQAPTALISTNTLEGDVPLTITFSGDLSTDPDAGDLVIGYEWDFGNGPEGDSVNEITHTFTEAGRHTVTLTVIDLFDVEDSTTVEIIVRDPQALLDWRQLHFSTQANSGDAADLEDPDKDGLVNFLEFALGFDPNITENETPLQISLQNSELTFQRTRTGLDYEIETSTNLSDWETFFLNPGTPGTEVTVTISFGPVPRFYRLSVKEL